MKPGDRIYLAGHGGLVGSALQRALVRRGFSHLILRRSAELDLRRQADVDGFFAATRPEYVLLAAAKVGGILANSSFPADFIRDNLQLQTNVIDAAHRHGVRKLCFIGSSCIYPRLAPQPMREEYLLSGPLEPTNEWYAIAKIAGIKMCQAYQRQYGFNAISVMPSNLYGPGDNFSLEHSHALPALIRRLHEAKLRGLDEVQVWGSGTPRREFLFVDDLADAVLFLMDTYEDPQIINVGPGEDITIDSLAQLIAQITGFKGRLTFDHSKPDGVPRKLLDVSRIHELGWKARTPLRQGIETTYAWFCDHREKLRA